MNVRIEPSWAERLAGDFAQPYFARLTDFVRREYQAGPCYPPGPQIFAAFDLCPFDKVKVVIIGQDPYHEPGQAEGLCFSVPPGTHYPPSLQNILKEIESDLGRPSAAFAGNVSEASQLPLQSERAGGEASGAESSGGPFWARQGVLLLNATLTVRAHQAGSHQRQGWEEFTDAVIRHLATEREGLVFILWGSYAQRKGAYIDRTRHLVLQSAHPSPLSAYRGFFGNHHFSLANDYLRQRGLDPIEW